MAWQTWVLIGLLVFSYYQYTNPTAANKLAEPVYGKVHDFLGDNNIFGGKQSQCPTTGDPVCGSDGVTYANTCLAAEAGMTQVTAGAC